jgi:hypothetical protein
MSQQQLYVAGSVPIVPGMAVELHADGNVYPANSLAVPQLPILGVAIGTARVVGDSLYIATEGVITVPNIRGLSAVLGQFLGDTDGSGNLARIAGTPSLTVTGFASAGYAISVSATLIEMLVSPLYSAGGGGGAAGVLSITVPVTASQILLGTAVTILPAPGAGKYYNVINVTMEYIAGNSGYIDVGGARATVLNGTQEIASIPLTGPPDFMLGTTSQVAFNGIQVDINGPFPLIPDLSVLVNHAVTFVLFGGPAANGNGTLKISVQYTLETA